LSCGVGAPEAVCDGCAHACGVTRVTNGIRAFSATTARTGHLSTFVDPWRPPDAACRAPPDRPTEGHFEQTGEVATDGRLVLGLGVGGRDDDHLAAGTDRRTRARRLEARMAVMRRLWPGEPHGDGVGPIGPAPTRPCGPEVLFGGFRPAALERVARRGDGLIAAAPPSWAGGLFDTVRGFWRAHGRDGGTASPRPGRHRARRGPGARRRPGPHARLLGVHRHGRPDGGRDARHACRDPGGEHRLRRSGGRRGRLYCYGPDPDQVDRLVPPRSFDPTR
jgi:hypothetical protein